MRELALQRPLHQFLEWWAHVFEALPKRHHHEIIILKVLAHVDRALVVESDLSDSWVPRSSCLYCRHARTAHTAARSPRRAVSEFSTRSSTSNTRVRAQRFSKKSQIKCHERLAERCQRTLTSVLYARWSDFLSRID